VPSWQGVPGRPLSERAALARAVVAKAVFNPPTTRLRIDTLSADKTPRRPWGSIRKCGVGSLRRLMESIRIPGVFMPRRFERQRASCHLPGRDTISPRAAGARRRGCEFASAAEGAHRFVHCICWRLAKRLRMTGFTVDSARHDEIRSPARKRSPSLIRLPVFGVLTYNLYLVISISAFAAMRSAADGSARR